MPLLLHKQTALLVQHPSVHRQCLCAILLCKGIVLKFVLLGGLQCLHFANNAAALALFLDRANVVLSWKLPAAWWVAADGHAVCSAVVETRACHSKLYM